MGRVTQCAKCEYHRLRKKNPFTHLALQVKDCAWRLMRDWQCGLCSKLSEFDRMN